nr:MAG TPA: hypothetical protein [Caudoviricetes sp.]DAN63516.1 MAG TPA: hypothetical protein [Caudoviricetes sp.]
MKTARNELAKLQKPRGRPVSEFPQWSEKKSEEYKSKIIVSKIIEFIQKKGKNKNIKEYSLFDFYKHVVKNIPDEYF